MDQDTEVRKSVKSFGLLVVIVFGAVLPSFSSASSIDAYFGVYDSKFKVEYESESGPVFNNGFQEVEIKRVSRSRTSYEVDNRRIPAIISVNSIGVNGHTCSYDGTGWLD
ncbi:hypothetical protein [Paludibacterium sp. THUN1379]|uniref:hypothetical protein n=1 Tax=Paludibacterium sp. THUN1379 TaxID=3112107 RepID=UPI0030CC2F2F